MAKAHLYNNSKGGKRINFLIGLFVMAVLYAQQYEQQALQAKGCTGFKFFRLPYIRVILF